MHGGAYCTSCVTFREVFVNVYLSYEAWNGWEVVKLFLTDEIAIRTVGAFSVELKWNRLLYKF